MYELERRKKVGAFCLLSTPRAGRNGTSLHHRESGAAEYYLTIFSICVHGYLIVDGRL